MADSDNDSWGHNHNNANRDSPASREQDRFLPIANVSRIMKKALPANAKIAKEAKETVQECVSEFISFITGEASDKCQREKRKTINGDDLLWAMTTLGFEDYVDPLKVYLHKFREIEEDKMIATGKLGKWDGPVDESNIMNTGSVRTGMYEGTMIMMGHHHHKHHHHRHMHGSGGSGASSGGRPR